MQIRLRPFAAAVLLALGLCGPVSAECVMSKFDDLPVTMSDLRPTVTVKVNGHDAVFFIDSGAFFSTITPEGAASFGLVKGPLPPGMTIRGAGGEADMSVGTAKTFSFAGIPFTHTDFLISETGVGGGAVGVIGQNLLSKVDVEYDFANGVMRLFMPEKCSDKFLGYWVKPNQPYSVVHISPEINTQANATATASVNGVKIKVLFDTGAGGSVVSTDAAARVGVKPPQAIAGSASFSQGWGLHSYMQTWIAPVDSFKLGDEEIQHTRLRFGDLRLRDDIDMLIGADFFLSHRVLVSNSQHKLYFTYNGGAVFNLTTAPPPTEAQPPNASTQAAASSQDAYSDTPSDAPGFERRAAAYWERREFAAVVADLTHAVALDPKEPRYLYKRGVSELALGKADAALADFDAALKLKPDYVEVVLERARFHRAQKDKARTREDLDLADHLAAGDADVRFMLAGEYDREGLEKQAVAQTDQWIAAHPKSDKFAEALNARCWVRARGDMELDKALADCNAALKLRPGSPEFLDSRALVHLRLGNVDKAMADYQAALRLMPNNPWTLYGHGLVELRKGLKTEGEADIARAVALRPDLPDEARAIGLAPP